MSSRTNVKPVRSQATRSPADGKSGKKRQDGTPEKVKTPCEIAPGELDNTRQAIVNDEILALQIKEEDLLKLRQPKPPAERKTTPVFNTVLIRKPKAVPMDHLQGKPVTVIRPAPMDAPIKSPDLTKLSGPRFDQFGNIIPNSILGNVDDFLALAVRTGDLAEGAAVKTSRSAGSLTPIGQLESRCEGGLPRLEAGNESNALKHWSVKMTDRRRQQNYLSRLLNKPIDQLVMNQAENYRKVQELRHLIDQTLPLVDDGKEEKIRGTEFWKLQTQYGDDQTGLHDFWATISKRKHSTLTQTEKGNPPPLEHVGVPRAVFREKGLPDEATSPIACKAWLDSSYLNNRMMKLAPLIDEIDPHHPDVADLEVVGNAHIRGAALKQGHVPADYGGREKGRTDTVSLTIGDPLRNHPDVYSAPIFGPSLRFGGFPAKWTGDAHSCRDQVAIDARVSFETYAGQRTMSFLDIGNDGTAAISFSWKRVTAVNPFNVASDRVQRFYFNQSNGIVLPGDMSRFPFVFKSPNAGVFSEQWEFQTHPVLAGGGKLFVTLRGVALQQDEFGAHRVELERDLEERQGRQIVADLVDEIVAGVRTPERPRSPVDAYVTEEELFTRRNPELYYTYDNFEIMKSLYEAALPDDDKGRPWDLHLSTIRETIVSRSNDDTKEDLLQQLNSVVDSASCRPYFPVFQTSVLTYTAGYSILSTAIDSIYDQDALLKASDQPSTSELSSVTSSGSQQHLVETASMTEAKKGTKDKKQNKDVKQQQSKKEPRVLNIVKPHEASGAQKSSSNATVSANASTAQVQPPDSKEAFEALQNKHKTTLYDQTYLILCEMVDTMDLVFGELLKNGGQNSFSGYPC